MFSPLIRGSMMIFVLPFLILIPTVQARAALPTVRFAQPAGWPQVLAARSAVEQVGPGVSYARWVLATAQGPLTLSITTVDLRNPFVGLRVATHFDSIVGPGERLSAMSDRVGAEAAINGDYFDINDSGSPLNVLVANSRIEHQPDGKAALIIDDANRVAVSVPHWSAQLVTRGGFTLAIAAMNDFAQTTNTTLVDAHSGSFDAAQLTEIALHPSEIVGTYRVAQVASRPAAPLKLGPDELGVAARGPVGTQLAGAVAAGDVVRLAQQWQWWSGAGSALVSPSPAGFASANVVSAIGGGPLLLRSGQPFEDPDPPAPQETLQRYPVSGAGVSGDGATLYLVTVDGRSPAHSGGITRPMLGALLASLGASDAIALDSGGSAEMAVRHLGDARTSVANVPSDGAERLIADGLFIVNTAPRGPAAQLIVRAPSDTVLQGSHLQLFVAAVDARMQPAQLPGPVRFSAAPTSLAAVDENGLVTARSAGAVAITASSASLRQSAALSVVPAVNRLTIVPAERHVPVYGAEDIHVSAQLANGTPVAVDDGAVRWSVSNHAARVDRDGRLYAGPKAANAIVTASVPGASARLTLPVGDHAIAVDLHPGRWRYAALPSSIPGGVDDAPAPDGSAGVRLAYDFSSLSGFRAAYAQTSLPLPGEPFALRLDVYGDGRREWLRAAYHNADGVIDTVTLARHVDWMGWKRVRFALSAQARWPVALTRLYVIEASPNGHEEGTLWFRSLEAIDPGP